ncbi:hypothetical protein QAD02_023791 [Eretmocerus hayati]|uniref:Uncharacterized protein n=1 Tax=Eretmocerus hayati TaxID=131215 RepID=A0ACC2PWU7_9HYME|nr:hypothetical protein QAD02_023791 [Eretmocerus hayati]
MITSRTSRLYPIRLPNFKLCLQGNYAKFLKNVHQEQAAKLLAKNQHECDLLEDIRNFVIKKSAIEKSYAEALLKISSAYLNKKLPNIPDLKMDAADDRWNMWNVWRTVLEENENVARTRLAAIEIFLSQIAEEAKGLRAQKLQIAKKSIDQLIVVQKELQLCVQDVDKTKKLYFDEEHSAHDVRDKAKDIEEKLKKKKGSFFHSITALQKNSAKVTSKRDQLEEKSTGARNDYLLALAAANAHQNRYFVVDLQSTMQYLEQGVYEKVAEYLTVMGRTELRGCQAMQTSFSLIRDQAQQLSREYNIQCCCLYYPVLKQHIQYDFEPCDNDPLDRVSENNAAAQTLSKEARRWATRIAREVNTYRESNRKLLAYQQLRESGQKTDPNDPNGPDLETKIEEMKQNMRKAETAKMKAEARLECLRKGGVNVDEALQEIDTLTVSDITRSASSLSLRTDSPSQADQQPSSESYYDSDNDAGSDMTTLERPGRGAGAQHQHQLPEDSDSGADERRRLDSAEVDALLEQEKQRIDEITAGWDDPTSADWGNEDDSGDAGAQTTDGYGSSSAAGKQVVYKCTALYSYTAQNPDELSIVESEQLEVVGEGDGDGWLRARNYRGEEGYVPQNYLDVEHEPEPTESSGLGSQQSGGIVQQISFSSVDYTVDDHDAVDPDALLQQQQQEAEQQRQAEQQQAQQAHKTPVTATESVDSAATMIQNHAYDGREYCIAMYDYEATEDGELTFMEGDIIIVLRKDPHEVDDGYWEGELKDSGTTGTFPSVLVDPCTADGGLLSGDEEDEDDVSPPSTSAPPVFTPPDAPELLLNEELARSLMNEMRERGYVNGDRQDNFDINLTKNQKDQYGLQFDNETPQAPEIRIMEAPDEGNNEEPEDQQNDDGLGVAQIVITAATPMDDGDKSFPGSEQKQSQEKKQPTEDKQEPPEEQQTQEDQSEQQEEPEESDESRRQSEDRSSEHQKVGPVSSSGSEEADSGPSDDSQRAGSTAQQNRGGGAAALDEEADVAVVSGSGIDEEDEPAQAPPPHAKVLVGGRASIPDELQPDQLQKLQNLKESNA